jgi:hypothetical protein
LNKSIEIEKQEIDEDKEFEIKSSSESLKEMIKNNLNDLNENVVKDKICDSNIFLSDSLISKNFDS